MSRPMGGQVGDRALVRAAAAMSLLAAAVHAGLIGEHLREWWGYGAFFVLASLAQGTYGLILLALPARPNWDVLAWRAWRRRLYLAGAAGNAAVIGLYVVSRTLGVPFVGPAEGEVEPVGALDLATKATEALLVGSLLLLRWRVAREGTGTGSPLEGLRQT
ncbi:MAG: hypothetical protein ACYC2H_11290 [Thermoplasmatota archaeon]